MELIRTYLIDENIRKYHLMNSNFYISTRLFTENISIGHCGINQIEMSSIIRESYGTFNLCKFGEMTSSLSQSNSIGSFFTVTCFIILITNKINCTIL